MDLILCHTTADFDALGAAVGLTCLQPGARIVLAGGCHPGVREFLALHRDEYALIERRSVDPQKIRSLIVVDTQQRDRLGKTAEWLDLPVPIQIWDHHLDVESDIPATQTQIEAVGATTTLIVEQLQKQIAAIDRQGDSAPADNRRHLTPAEATVMALGIHVDTGSLTFDHATARDAAALAWLMERGASVRAIAEYIEPGLSPQLQDLLAVGLRELQSETIQGNTVSWVVLESDAYVPGLAGLASHLLELTESDVVLLAHYYPVKSGNDERLTLIGRSRIPQTNLHELFKPLGGGGHPRAASAALRNADRDRLLPDLLDRLKRQIPHPPLARELMSSPVRTIRPDTTIHEAHRILLRYGHSGLSVVDSRGQLVGVISRRDLDIALHHGFSHAPVKGYMTTNLKTIAPDTTLQAIEALMVTYDIGRLPVLENDELIGIVTRTDLLRQLHQDKAIGQSRDPIDRIHPYCPLPPSVKPLLARSLVPPLARVLDRAAQLAEERGWHLYLVGGGVRDLLLAVSSPSSSSESDEDETSGLHPCKEPLMLGDIDLVVDGFHKTADVGAGMELAKALRQLYPAARLDIHGQFQTAALLWHKDPVLDSLWVDIATARTEFYPYPAANPEVEASSIRQDLYRRDFTINALALRLTGGDRAGQILDFFGGWLDLQDRRIRVLHANSFIEDPTRIYRAVRFAVRLGFEIEAQTERYIRHALESGIYERMQKNALDPASGNRRAPALETRLKSELKYILQAPYWKSALELLGDLGALRCIHPSLKLNGALWRELCLVDRGLQAISRRPARIGGDLPPCFSQLPEYWQIRLEVILAHLAPGDRRQVATNLQMSVESIDRLDGLAEASEAVSPVSELTRPSAIVRLLRRYDVLTLMLVAVRAPRPIRRKIWQYLTEWIETKPLLDGHDLKTLGYKPGPRYKKILDAVLAATLDRAIVTRAEAEAFIQEHFP
ncbi:CBS domain-containing protein [Oxynema sp. CENA135]|uniref:CBS domain-containing protein n=1 Tax=Oxynema sp. CENA135 TaxID=984206 RepID=UPI00190A88E8|nr:CBS domain-containing protein [Oxynema sp. CENA135]MBK4731577.1 CBS domain-containing protein [Oxynema sp. CENA135]